MTFTTTIMPAGKNEHQLLLGIINCVHKDQIRKILTSIYKYFCTIYVKEIMWWILFQNNLMIFLLDRDGKKRAKIYIYEKNPKLTTRPEKPWENKRSSLTYKKNILDPTVDKKRWIHRPKSRSLWSVAANPIEQEILKGKFVNKFFGCFLFFS